VYVLVSKTQTKVGSRREAILAAMIEVAGSKGYAATSVTDVVAAAGASRATFYRYFEDKEDCFLAAFELAARRVVEAATTPCGEGWSWRESARRGLVAVIELLADDPALAATVVVEAARAGAEARRRYSEAIDRVAQLLAGEDGAPRRAELPASTGLMAVSAVTGLVFDRLREGEATELPRLLPELEFALLVPYLGPRAAAEACSAPAPLSA